MFFIGRHMEHNEEIIYKLKKKKKSLIFVLMFVPFWLVFCFPPVQCFKNSFLGKVSFDSYTSYMISIFMLSTFIPLMTIILLNYIANTLIITNQRVYIRKAMTGCLLIIDLKDIMSYKYLEINNKGFKSHYFRFILLNNECHKTGNLFINDESLREITGVLIKLINPKNLVIKGKPTFKEPVNCNVKIFRNLLFSAVYYAPFFIAAIMLVLLLAGFNHRVGKQTNIELSGIVEKKSITHDSKSNYVSYTISLSKENDIKSYDINVNAETFNMFSEGETALVRAKKGSLGIVYDEVFYKK